MHVFYSNAVFRVRNLILFFDDAYKFKGMKVVASSQAIRQAFIEFFKAQGHTPVPSAPLVPENDPTLLFVNAGMVQFKNVFTGDETRPFTRAVSSQRCVRAGGKHNDLENVGHTARHHTFFEMLGNFSFGDYFKREAIQFAWTFLTEVVKLPAEKLWVTVYEDDDETADIWLKEMKVSDKRFSRCGAADNFWSMGDTGPCGPCTEIFYDHGEAIAGGPPGSPDQDGDRYVEIWNLVFMQFNRDKAGTLTPLPKPSVDTGMGLERLSAVLQGVHNNYDTDLFMPLIHAAAKLAGLPETRTSALCVIADHIRASAFLITDGVVPGNDGRQYVLRRIIRRALRHAHQIGIQDLFFYKLVPVLIDIMGEAYPELVTGQSKIETVLKEEETQFRKTLSLGLGQLEEALSELKQGHNFSGEMAFKLYDTYGFPIDLTADILRERSIEINYAEFEAKMAAQRARSRAASGFAGREGLALDEHAHTEFKGYECTAHGAKIIGLYRDGKAVETLSAEEVGEIILDRTPFYAESGGQVGDTGVLHAKTGEFTVSDTQKQQGRFVHSGVCIKGELKLNLTVDAMVDVPRRQAVALNHTATHLLHAALRVAFGDKVAQKGSLVLPNKLRFDFTFLRALTQAELEALEKEVNIQIRANLAGEVSEMTPDEAIAKGAIALFSERYGGQVRVLKLGDFSMEVCGGTHVPATGEIGIFKIISETAVAAGVRRIEAVTGEAALEWIQAQTRQLQILGNVLKTSPNQLEEKITKLLSANQAMEKENQAIKSQSAKGLADELMRSAIEIEGISVLAHQVPGMNRANLRDLVDQLKQKLPQAVIVLATVENDKVALIAGISKACMPKFHAGQLVNHVATQVGGKGGGRPDMAQAGGTAPDKLSEALASVPDWVISQLT